MGKCVKAAIIPKRLMIFLKAENIHFDQTLISLSILRALPSCTGDIIWRWSLHGNDRVVDPSIKVPARILV